jgi:hypothetical protein
MNEQKIGCHVDLGEYDGSCRKFSATVKPDGTPVAGRIAVEKLGDTAEAVIHFGNCEDSMGCNTALLGETRHDIVVDPTLAVQAISSTLGYCTSRML